MLKPPDLDPKAVRLQFGRRQRRLERADFLLREVERRMLERLDLVRRVPATAIDVGSGLGHGAARMQQRYAQALVLGFDLAPGLAAAAARLHGRPARRSLAGRLQSWFGAAAGTTAASPAFAAADACRLPLRAGGVDLIWSNLAWHWFADPAAVLAEWYRVVRPEGLLMFSAFGVDTLRELRALGVALPQYPDLHDVGDALAQAGFAEPVMDAERLTITWREPQALLDDLRALGGNALRGRSRGLHTPAQRRGWLERIESLRGPQGSISIGFEIVYGHAWCPPRKRLPDGYSAIDFVPRRPA